MLGILMMAVSCHSEDGITNNAPNLIPVERGSELLSIFEEIDLIVLALVQEDIADARRIHPLLEHYGEKVVLTSNLKDGSVTVDFGADSESDRGVRFRGMLRVYLPTNFWAKGSLTRIVLDSFYVDNVQISGVRSLVNAGYELNSKMLTFDASMANGLMTWPQEEAMEITYHLQRRLEVSSVEDQLRFSLTGITEMKDKFGRQLTVEVVAPMVFQEKCMFSGKADPLSGSILVSRGDANSMTVNFKRACN